MRKSFTLSVKQEIIEADRTHEEAVLFFVALLKINGTHDSGIFKIRINDQELREKTLLLLNKTFRTRATIKEKNIVVKDSIMEEDFTLNISDIELETEEEYRSYITGLFFGKGYVSTPVSKYYHLEIRFKNLVDAMNITELLNSMGMTARFQEKGKSFRVYIKKSEQISDLLTSFKSPTFSMVYIDQKIQRDFNAALSRQNAIDVWNQEKIAIASNKHIISCTKALSNLIKYRISKEEERVAKLRIKHPEYSSQDLAYKYNEIYVDDKSKSTVNRWLNHIVKLVEEVDNE